MWVKHQLSWNNDFYLCKVEYETKPEFVGTIENQNIPKAQAHCKIFWVWASEFLCTPFQPSLSVGALVKFNMTVSRSDILRMIAPTFSHFILFLLDVVLLFLVSCLYICILSMFEFYYYFVLLVKYSLGTIRIRISQSSRPTNRRVHLWWESWV